MIEYGSHNSVTGYEGKGFISKLLTPFARCQTKTLTKQVEAGVRYFDIRIKYHKGEFVLCHGLWISKLSVINCFNILDSIGINTTVYVDITLETNSHVNDYLKYCKMLKDIYENIHIANINVKKPVWKNLVNYLHIRAINKFITLDGSSWHTLIPIPWLWNKIYKFKYEDGYINIIDFV